MNDLLGKHCVRILATLILVSLSLPVLGASKAQPLSATMPHVKASGVSVDGRIGADEYQGHYLDGDTEIEVYWEHDGVNMYVGLVSPGTGWVGIGFGPSGIGMDGANMVIGYVKEGKLDIKDVIGVGYKHYSDVSRGGRDDVIDAAGAEGGGKTTLEFVFPLDSGDSLDHSFKPGGTYGFFLAYEKNADDFVTYHTGGRSQSIVLSIEPAVEAKPVATRLTLKTPRSVNEDEPFRISGSLRGLNGVPVPNATINIYINTTFGGRLNIASAKTNLDGAFAFSHAFRRSGVFAVEATYLGGATADHVFKSSNSSVLLTVKSYGAASNPGGFGVQLLVGDNVNPWGRPEDPFYNWGLWILNRPHDEHVPGVWTETDFSLAVVSAVYILIVIPWAMFLYTVYQLYRASGEGGRKVGGKGA
ncbi:MAG: DOMON domain-containing protein [Candidatus Geothermarchaeales archaeon]